MKWLPALLRTSVGLKLMMALSGLCFCGFLIVHAAGNLTLYGGKTLFNSYAEHLHALGVLVTIMGWCLLILALIHITTGLFLFVQNLCARPVRYRINHRAGGRTLGSATMPYTGVLLAVFIVIHLIDFHFVDKTGTTIFDIVSTAFSSPIHVSLYVVGVLLAAVHFSHGFWSAFQTIGAAHSKYTPAIKGISVAMAVIIGAGLGLVPLFVSLSA